MKKLLFVFTLFASIGAYANSILCNISLVQQNSQVERYYNVSNGEDAIGFEFDPKDGTKTIEISKKLINYYNSDPSMPKYGLQINNGSLETITKITLENLPDINYIAFDLESNFGSSSSLGFSYDKKAYARSVMVKLDDNHLGVVVIGCNSL